MTETKFTTITHDQYGEVLLKDGKETICPFQPALTVPVQSTLGGVNMQIIRFPCSTGCPHASLKNYGKQLGILYETTSGMSANSFEIEEGSAPDGINTIDFTV